MAAAAAMSLFRFQASTNSTAAALNDERYASAKSIRTSTTILACINAVAALATAGVIVWDARARRTRSGDAAARVGSGFRSEARPGLCLARGRDAFPFALSVGVIVQAVVFAVAQSTGLQDMMVLGCRQTSQVLFPAAFIVPYLQLVFGVELGVRAALPGRFRVPQRWLYFGCLGAVAVFLAAHALAAQLVRPPNLCFASLFWFLRRYAVAAFALLLATAGLLFLATVGVVVRLRRDAKVPLEQRVTASRMVYYMAVAVVSDLLLVPLFHSLAFADARTAGPTTLQLSLIADVVANVSGLLTGGLYLFLRSNTLITIGGASLSQPTRSNSGRSGTGSAPTTASAFASNPYGSAMAAPTLAPLKPSPVRLLQRLSSQPSPPPMRTVRSESTESLVASAERAREEEAAIESPVMPPPSVYGTASSLRDSFSTTHSASTASSPKASLLRSPYASRPPPPLPMVVPLAMSPSVLSSVGDLNARLEQDNGPQTPYSLSLFPSPRTTTVDAIEAATSLLPATTYALPPAASGALPPTTYAPRPPSVSPAYALPSTTYAPPPVPIEVLPPSASMLRPFSKDSLLLPPPPLPGSIIHRRGSSLVSSATVQIGLRLSNVDDMAPLRARYNILDSKVYSISDAAGRLTVPGSPVVQGPAGPSAGRKPSPLGAAADDGEGSPAPRPPPSVYPADDETALSRNPSLAYYLSGYYTLPSPPPAVPPLAGAYSQGGQQSQQQQQQQPKLPSPKGVGFNVPPQAPRRPWI